MSIIYGIDTTKPFTTVDVRDAIVQCFFEAHKDTLEFADQDVTLTAEEKDTLHMVNAKAQVKKVFSDIGAEYDHPSKEHLALACNHLAEFSKAFRKHAVVDDRLRKMMQLIEQLPA